MKISMRTMSSFVVIGKEGSCRDGQGFIQRLWAEANSQFAQVAHLAKRDEHGSLVGVWGVMTDFQRNFMPWENNFSEGLYLAGVESTEDAQPPEGWAKWVVPAFTYVQVHNGAGNAFRLGLAYLQEQGLTLVGAVQEYTDPATGEGYMLFPVRRL